MRLIVLALITMLGLSAPAAAQKTSGGFTGGSIKIGYDNRTCNGSLTGSIRYNSASNNLASSNLAGYWKLDETSGTSAADSSGNGRTGTMVGGLSGASNSVAGQVGTALNLDGVDDQIQIADNAAFVPGTNDFSLSMWFKTTATVEGTLISKMQCASLGEHLWQLGMWADGRLYYRIGDGDEILLVSDTVNGVNNGTWHHIAVAFDRDATANMYVDGILRTSNSLATIGSVNDPSAYKVIIGATTACGSIVPWKGQLDEVRYYSRALTAQEDEDLYQCGLNGGNCAAMEVCNGLSWKRW